MSDKGSNSEYAVNFQQQLLSLLVIYRVNISWILIVGDR